MTDFLEGDEGGEGFGVEVIRSSIPPARRELSEAAPADSFPRVGSSGVVRLMSWELLGMPDISRIAFRMLTALLTAPLAGLAVSAGRLAPALVTPALGRDGASGSGQRGLNFILFMIRELKRLILSAVRWETSMIIGERNFEYNSSWESPCIRIVWLVGIGVL